MDAGLEWIVDVTDCAPQKLAGSSGESTLRGLFDDLVCELDLHPVADPLWHRFPGAGGVTGLMALSESHLACHSYPENSYLSLNLYTCKPRSEPDWDRILTARLGNCEVRVRRMRRGSLASSPAPATENKP